MESSGGGYSFKYKKCRELFQGSLRQAQFKAIENLKPQQKILPNFSSLEKEVSLVQSWNKGLENIKKEVSYLSAFLPKSVFFISHRQRKSLKLHVVKTPAEGKSIILRVFYQSQGKTLSTNMTMSIA